MQPMEAEGLTVDQLSFTRGTLDGKPCVVIYDAVQDKTSIISWQSKDYVKAMAALSLLEVFSVPHPELEKKTVLHAPKRSRIIRPGMQ